MKLVAGAVRLSPTDLTNYAACEHLTTLDLQLARGELKKPDDFCLVTEALRRRGEAHERAYMACAIQEMPLKSKVSSLVRSLLRTTLQWLASGTKRSRVGCTSSSG
jgi:hypothetical protein